MLNGDCVDTVPPPLDLTVHPLNHISQGQRMNTDVRATAVMPLAWNEAHVGLHPISLRFPISVDMESGCGPDFIPITVRVTIVSLRAVRKSRQTGAWRTTGMLKWKCLVADVKVWKEERGSPWSWG